MLKVWLFFLAIGFSDDVQHNVKRKLDFDELKSISKQKPF